MHTLALGAGHTHGRFAQGDPVSSGNSEMEIHIMALYENTIRLKGFVGKDAATHTTTDNKTFATFELATKSSYKDKGGEWQSQTYWHHVVVFGKHADIAAQLTKGDYVELKGESRSSEFESVTDGVTIKQRRSEVRATALRKLERPARQSDDAASVEEASEVAA